jgi:hypothetical protein
LSGGVPLDLIWKKYFNGIYIAKLTTPFDFNSLYVNGIRKVRARFPNGGIYYFNGLIYNVDPNIPYPEAGAGYTFAADGFPLPLFEATSIFVSTPERNQTQPNFVSFFGGSVAKFSTFTSPLSDNVVPQGMYFDPATFSSNLWRNPSTAVVHIFHPYVSQDKYYNNTNFSSSGEIFSSKSIL